MGTSGYGTDEMGIDFEGCGTPGIATRRGQAPGHLGTAGDDGVEPAGIASPIVLDHLNHRDLLGPDIVGTADVAIDVNMRSGPHAAYEAVRILPPRTAVSVAARVENGYRQIVHDGLIGWVWDGYLGGCNAEVALTTTSAVYHRAAPNRGSKVLAIIPAGATAYGRRERSSGFEKVAYDGKIGWVYASYLD